MLMSFKNEDVRPFFTYRRPLLLDYGCKGTRIISNDHYLGGP